ncbi:MAG TPA: T9SS type A sorting domain-containing protein [Chitinophagales bacterium]|nr:T9SS type A sorting domain-containing protein [Chitinophagales bacterium]
MKKLLLLVEVTFVMTSLVWAQTDQTWMDLDGSNDFLDFGTDPILAGQTQFTVEMRIHFESNAGDFTLLGQRNADNNRTIVIQRWAGAFYVFISNGNYGTCAFVPCLASIYHIAVVYDGTGVSNSARLKLYINGSLQTLEFNGTIDAASYTTSPPAHLVLGCEHNGPSTQLQFVNGQFGEWCVWNYPLTEEEISKRVIPEVTGNENGLVEYFHFDNGVPGGDNTTLTSFAGGKSVCTITPVNMAMNGASSNFTGLPALSTSVTVNDSMLTSNASGATYQWLDCNNDFAMIPGATSQSYIATTNGSYAVQVTMGICTDTSDCILIAPVGIAALEISDLVIYPNPVMNELIMEDKMNKEQLSFEILNSTGQVILNGDLTGKTVVATSDFAPGIYVVKITGKGIVEWRKIMKN